MKTNLLYYLVLTLATFGCVDNTIAQDNKKGEDEIIFPERYTKLVFQDEFDAEGLPNSAQWGFEEGYLRNGELQYYTKERAENCYQKDGKLYLVAKNDSALINGEKRAITSASITTKG